MKKLIERFSDLVKRNSGDNIPINAFSPQKIVDKKIYILSPEFRCNHISFGQRKTRSPPRTINTMNPKWMMMMKSATTLVSIPDNLTVEDPGQSFNIQWKIGTQLMI